MSTRQLALDTITVDGNEAAAKVAYDLSDVVAIYPITPASPMGELCDVWAAAGKTNRFGAVPTVIEMQSEGGAAGAVHGALQSGAMTTTFTASQGLLLMIPNIYKLVGELTPTVIHVAARALATHALSIFGDHSDVMAARQTGAAMLASSTVQEAQDLALVAHAATLRTRVPFVHFFDGFRTSHEVSKIDALPTEAADALIDHELIASHRLRGLDPNRPVIRGTAQNPDVFFQAREAANPFHDSVPLAVETAMNQLAEVTGRSYHLFDYDGAEDAEDILVVMGSGTGAAHDWLPGALAAGRKVGVVTVRLFRPFSIDHLLEALPSTTRRIAVLDRTKEPGSVGEPLYTDVSTALVEKWDGPLPLVIGGRYGLGSKEFTPAMVEGIFAELTSANPRRHFTVGIVDDVTMTSIPYETASSSSPEIEDGFQAVFFGLGSDGTVGANKTTAKIIGAETNLRVQGYFVYDSKKSGAMTVSHLRFGPDPITSTYLIDHADFVACHRFSLLERADVIARCRTGATLLLNSPHQPDDVWTHLPSQVRHDIAEKKLEVWTVDADAIAAAAGIPGRVNTVLQACFFALTDLIDTDVALTAMKDRLSSSYGRQGAVIVERNSTAIDNAIAALHKVDLPTEVEWVAPKIVTATNDSMLQMLLAGKGDLLPVSALPVDGTFATGTSKWEKRSIASHIPIWDSDICIDCGRCALVCPHSAIRMKSMDEDALTDQPDSFRSKLWKGPEGDRMTIQVAPDDCTGCGVCVDICPAKSKSEVKHRAINMEPIAPHLDDERANFDFFLELPEAKRSQLKLLSVKGSQLAQPLFEFSGACSGCGETPYVKLLSQLFGDRMLVANATGCSSIYGGNLPTTPWTTNAEGRGPAWANSLFEDNAEFGLGMRLGLDSHHDRARALVGELRDTLGPLAESLTSPSPKDEGEIAERRQQIDQLRSLLIDRDDAPSRELVSLADHLLRTEVWIVGGDGWAYDIGFGGVDHVLASGLDVNILVLDTEVYSNTGGQTSKATPRAAVAKFATGGKTGPKKDLGTLAMAYGDVFVAQVAMGANMTQTIKAFHEAAAHRGPSLIIAYSPCIAHGIDMTKMMEHQKLASETGYWPLYRFDPAREAEGDHALHLDSRPPSRPFTDFARTEGRFASLERTDRETARRLFGAAQADIDNRWHLYEQMVNVERIASYVDLEEDE